MLLSALLVSGCGPARPDVVQTGAVMTKVQALENDARTLRLRLMKLEVARSQYAEVSIDATTKAYQRLDTSIGTLLVSCQDIQPYANGYKIKISVGNPMMATLQGFKLKVSWGPSWDDTTVTDWETARHENTFDFTDKLLPGKWNHVAVVIAPAEPRDLNYVGLSLEPNIVSLWR